VPREFDRVLARALAKAPDDRFPSAGDLGRAALAAAEGRSVTEAERSVARGEAAPRTLRQPDVTLPLGERDPEPEVRRYRSRPRRLWALLAGAAAFVAVAAALADLTRGGTAPPPGGTVSSSDVERLARSFAHAYAAEDAERLSRLLTSDVQRVTPGDRERGRSDVVAAYRSQFAANATTGFTLSGLHAHGGPAARATARYRASYRGAADTTGTLVLDAILERGRPRIQLISARPD
jgi:serine/threonine-protein kinase